MRITNFSQLFVRLAIVIGGVLAFALFTGEPSDFLRHFVTVYLYSLPLTVYVLWVTVLWIDFEETVGVKRLLMLKQFSWDEIDYLKAHTVEIREQLGNRRRRNSIIDLNTPCVGMSFGPVNNYANVKVTQRRELMVAFKNGKLIILIVSREIERRLAETLKRYQVVDKLTIHN